MNSEECFEKLAPEVKRFLAALRKTPPPPISLKTYEGMRQFLISTTTRLERERFAGDIEDTTIPGPAGAVPVRVYRPAAEHRLPLLLYFHGGGWVLGNLDTEEDTCLSLAKQVPCVALSVDYRLAPEHPYPAALDDCEAALDWAAASAQGYGADPKRIAVAGESAGGNLAAALSLRAKDRGGPAIAFQVLFYPAVNLTDSETESRISFGEGFFLGKRDMEGARSLYAPDERDRSSPYVSPLFAPNLRGLPPAVVVTAGCDPLRDDAEAYGKRLREAGVPVTCIRFEDMIHAFLVLFKSSESRSRALSEAARSLHAALGA